MNFGSARKVGGVGGGGGGGYLGLYSRVIAYSIISPPFHFRLDVVYKNGGAY